MLHAASRNSLSGQIQGNGERTPLLRDNVVIAIPPELIDNLEKRGCCSTVAGQRMLDVGKLSVYGFKRFLQDLSIYYAGYTIVTNFSDTVESPYAYIPVIGLTVLTTVEDVWYEVQRHFMMHRAPSDRQHNLVKIAKGSIDAGFAAGVYLSGYQSNNQNYTIVTTVAGLALIGSKLTLDIIHHTQRQCAHNNRFKIAKNILDTVSAYCVAAGVAEFCTNFLQEAVFDGKQYVTSETVNRVIQNAVGLLAAIITFGAKRAHSHKAEEILESVIQSVIYVMMGTIISYDVYTSAEPNNSIPDSYGYTMLGFFMLTMLAFYGQDIYNTVKRPTSELNVNSFTLVEPAVAVEDGSLLSLAADAEVVAADADVGVDAEIAVAPIVREPTPPPHSPVRDASVTTTATIAINTATTATVSMAASTSTTAESAATTTIATTNTSTTAATRRKAPTTLSQSPLAGTLFSTAKPRQPTTAHAPENPQRRKSNPR